MAALGEWQVACLLLVRSSLRRWRRHWGSYVLLVAIVAIGVGAFNGIRQASRAASANFGLFNEAISGRSDFFIERKAGRLTEEDLFELQTLGGDPDWHVVPVIEGGLTQLDAAGEGIRQLRLIGLDLIAVGNLPQFVEQGFELSDEDDDWYTWIGLEPRIWVANTLARAADIKSGDRVSVATGGVVLELLVAGILGVEDSGLPDDLVIADLPAAQAILARDRQIDRIEIVVTATELRSEADYLQSVRAAIERNLPSRYVLIDAADRLEKRSSMTEAFRLNLMILSLIAILVGLYLILQALDASVVRRRHELATFRSLGVASRSLFWVCLLEALLIGVLGSFCGIGVGYVLAMGAVHLLADTVNALYFATSVSAIQLSAEDWLVGMLLGVVFSLVAGWLPARDAMQTPPAQVLSRGDWSPGFSWLRRPYVGMVFLAFGILALWIPSPVMSGGAKMALGGFLAAGLSIIGVAVLSGQCLVWLAWWLRRLSLGAVWRVATSRLADGSSRHRLAVAGLVVAVGMVSGMFQMVGSFRTTIVSWFDVRFQAELYISENSNGGASSMNGIRPEILERLRSLNELEFMDALYVAEVDAPVGVTTLAGVDFDVWSNGELRQIWVVAPGVLEASVNAQPAYVSETFARRFGVMKGGVVELRTPTGIRLVTPIAIFADYGNEFGSAVVDVTVWKEWAGLDRALNTSLYLKPDVDVNGLRDRLRIEFPGLSIRNAGELRELALGIFDQTFRVTGALNGIGVAVAMLGLLLGLFAIFEESSRTWITLDHLGYGQRRIFLTAGLEGAGIALAAWISGTALGLLLGWLLIHVINVESFGWTLLWRLPFWELLRFGALLIMVGFLSGFMAGLYWYKRRHVLCA